MKNHVVSLVALLGLAGFSAAAEVPAVPLTPETFALNLQQHVDTLARHMPSINYKFTFFPAESGRPTQWHSPVKSYEAVRGSVVQAVSGKDSSEEPKLIGTRSEQLSAYFVLRALDDKPTRETIGRLTAKLPGARKADFENTLAKLEKAAAIFNRIPRYQDCDEKERGEMTQELGYLLIQGADRPTLEAESAAMDDFFSEDKKAAEQVE